MRETITAPLIDALHSEAGILRKTLTSGLTYDFHYRSKIARELVMSPDAIPDHVWEPQTTKLLMHLASRGGDVVIGGAYAGDQALPVAQVLARCGGTVHAFEPNPDQRSMLAHNCALNGLDNVVINAEGLWHDAETRLVLVGDDSFAHPEVVAGDTMDEGAFATVSIDRYGRERGLGISLVMLDIEGAELEALRGCAGYLSRPRNEAPVVVFELHRAYVDWSAGLDQTEIVRFMTGHGYRVLAVRDFNSNVPMGQAPVELVPTEATYLEGPPHGFNMLAVKDPSILDSPLFRICEHVSPKLLWHKDPALHHPMHAA